MYLITYPVGLMGEKENDMEQKFCQSCGMPLTNEILREYLAKHYAIGDFITSGPQIPRIGGVIMIKANNREAVDAIISEDPFHINDIANYQIVEFTPTMFCNEELKTIL